MLDFSTLSPLMKDLHAQAVTMFYVLLPVFFSLAILVQWFREPRGAVDFVVLIKRAFISVLLLVAFPEITQGILAVSGGIAEKIDSVRNLDRFMAIAEMKVESYSLSPQSLLLGFNDLFLATLRSMNLHV